MTRDVSRIPDVLERQLRPIYEAVGDAQATEAQMLIAKNALYGAQERMFVHKHENKGKLPIAELKNLLGEEPCTSSRHVTICISGWMSQNCDKAHEWV